MKCPSCRADVAVEDVFPGGSVQCACGASLVVPLAPARSTASQPPADMAPPSLESPCPRCRVPLVMRDEDGIVVTACPAEHGLFVAHRVLHELTQHSPDAVRALDRDVGGAIDTPSTPPGETTELACPHCAKPMTRRTFARESTIVVDACEAHGTWFDAGELRAASALTAARSHDVPELADPSLHERAAATLDVALALEQARDEETARRGVDLANDLLDTFNIFVLGRNGWDARRRRR